MLAMARPASAQDAPRIHVSAGADPAIIAGSLLGTLAMSWVPVTPSRWTDEVLPIDRPWRGTFSATHGMISNTFILTAMVTPVVAEAVRSDRDAWPKMAVYAEALSVGGFINAVAKYAVQRPRPYTYGEGDAMDRHTEAAGNDAYLSFFSGHATTAFAAAVSGGYLFAYGNPNTGSRVFVWGWEMAFASATATERVRAGAHFPSDVVLGAMVGSGIGILVPRAHMSDRHAVAIQPAEWAAIGGGLVLGTATSLALPRFPWYERRPAWMDVQLVPSMSPGGASVSAQGTF